MRTRIIFFIIIIGLILIGGLWLLPRQANHNNQKIKNPSLLSNLNFAQKQGEKRYFMKFSSSAFKDNSNIPFKYSCDGDDINPPLQISDVPKGAASLALIVDDPDAPAGDWVHWLVWNIAPDTTEIVENSVPNGAVQGLTDFGKNQWGGPCPPSGRHHYQFKLYALDTNLGLDSSAKKKDLQGVMQGHILDQAILVGLYQRK